MPFIMMDVRKEIVTCIRMTYWIQSACVERNYSGIGAGHIGYWLGGLELASQQNMQWMAG